MNQVIRNISIIALLLLFGCSPDSKKIDFKIVLQNGSALKITGPDSLILNEIQRDSGAWQTIFPVYRMPADTDMKDFQRPQPGAYRRVVNAILFTPDTPFVNGQTYFLRSFQFGEGKSTWDIIRHKQKLGSQAYTDLTFKMNGE